ncbi:SRPBCC family protein [uncultured Polaribacter sp.]|uniref:SRPBCC family protein n=1 Tax=uncultured Polaribacter sp. TaxID=174711 RepID=UPI002624D006|nr:SRPBCC family protein [uncultured Polaribacter sp.]
MPIIHLTTVINTNNIALVFNLIRSIDLHIISTNKTNEKAIAGKTSGLIGLNETVTWQAKHLGITQKLTSKVTDYTFPTFFADEMVKGAFKSFRHEHYLEQKEGVVIIKDVFKYRSPLGYLGKLADFLFLKKYMTNFLKDRNITIKNFAETEKWKLILKEN